MQWVARVLPKTEVTMTVCTGVFTLSDQGLLDGKEATTHFGAIDLLRRSAPRVKVRDDVRLCDNGQIVTTAGISAGIDGALHVVGRLCGEQAARDVARYMEYRWERTAAR